MNFRISGVLASAAFSAFHKQPQTAERQFSAPAGAKTCAKAQVKNAGSSGRTGSRRAASSERVTGGRLLWIVLGLALFCGFAGAASAQSCVTPPSGMIAWWNLDETSGIIAKDSVGTEPAAYFGDPDPIQRPGEVAGALQFNGSNDFLGAPQSKIWDFGSSDFTVELWANFAAVPGGDLVHAGAIFIGDDEGPGLRNKWFFALGGGLLHFTVYNTASPPPNFYLVRAPFVPVVGKWYHLAAIIHQVA
jgi:hypothetical protein